MNNFFSVELTELIGLTQMFFKVFMSKPAKYSKLFGPYLLLISTDIIMAKCFNVIYLVLAL